MEVYRGVRNMLFNTFFRSLSSMKIIRGFNQMKIETTPKRPALPVTHKITSDISYITNDASDFNVDPRTLKFSASHGTRPLCVMLCYLNAKPRQVHKYASIYLDQGFDVLTTRQTFGLMLRPDPAFRNLAGDLVKFLEQNMSQFRPVVLHGFSAGVVLWSSVLKIMESDIDRYRPIIDAFKAQIWDSMVDHECLTEGVSAGFFPNNRILGFILDSFFKYSNTTEYYVKASAVFRRSVCHAPLLHFYSKVDPVGLFTSNADLDERWCEKGIQITSKIFQDTPHVSHFYYKPKDYLAEIYKFFEENQLLYKPDVLRNLIESSKNREVRKMKE